MSDFMNQNSLTYNTTNVANRFIDEYMENASEAQIKVYLYLLRVCHSNQSTKMSVLADKFNYTEREIVECLKYWEKANVLTISYDGKGDPIGVQFVNLETYKSTTKEQNLSVTMQNPNASGETLSVTASGFEKPSYKMEQIKAFIKKPESPQLIFAVETYIGHPLTPAELGSLLFFSEVLHFSDDLIDHLVAYCVEREKTDFRYIEKVAISWAEKGITSPAQTSQVATRYPKEYYQIMNGLGKSNSPTPKEAEFINKWFSDYEFGLDIILEACSRAVMATEHHRFKYADTVLARWLQENVQCMEDIHRLDEVHKQRISATGQKAQNKFNQFPQNTYDFDALERDLLSN